MPGAQGAPLAAATADRAHLGAQIRILRRARGLTMVRLAEATGLSHPFLSQLERGRAQPSLTSLRRIAVALGTSPIELIGEAEAEASALPRIEVVSPGEGALSADFSLGTARMLADARRPFHPMEYEADNADPGESYRHDEDEFVFVLDSRVCVDLDGDVRVLGPGESAYYAGGVAHRWWSADGCRYRLLVVKQRVRGA